ncbi:MAG: hypothetical protein JNL80_15405 [Phycisphaerae bacterium]|nr:hypothetical protein [Phycisphaerae bacterium]
MNHDLITLLASLALPRTQARLARWDVTNLLRGGAEGSRVSRTSESRQVRCVSFCVSARAGRRGPARLAPAGAAASSPLMISILVP